jgi:CheY-like chemotaxis protein
LGLLNSMGTKAASSSTPIGLTEERTTVPTGGNRTSKVILIIDDNPDVRQVLKLTLSRAGYDVETASQGKAGLEKARDTRPDLILLDIMLPDIDGWQVCRRLREITDVPIVMLTVLSGADETIKGLSLARMTILPSRGRAANCWLESRQRCAGRVRLPQSPWSRPIRAETW